MRKTLLIYFIIIPFTSAQDAEFQVNTHTTWDQKDADVAIAEDGSFLVAWNSYRQDSDSGGIFGQLFDSGGYLWGSEFQINTTILGNQAVPSVAMGADGNFIVVWQGPGASGDDIFAQRFDPNALPLGVEFQVNSLSIGQQSSPDAAMNAGGRFAVVWESQITPQDPNISSICGQLFDSSGSPAGAEFAISTALTDCRYPAAAMDDNGNFAVVWLQQNGSKKIMMRLYDANNYARTEPLQVNKVGFSSITEPAIAMDGSGYFVITWDGDPGLAGLDDIHARPYAPNGIPIGNQFVVNTTLAGAQQNPAVAMNGQGEFVIAWNSETDPNANERDIYGQRFDGLGSRIGSEFQINSYTVGDQRSPAVALSRSGKFVTVWQSDGQDGSRYGIFGRLRQMVGLADFTGDGFVDFKDYNILASEWSKYQTMLHMDLIEDNIINQKDLAAFCLQWLTSTND